MRDNPFKSQAQARLFFAKEARGELAPGTAERWMAETPDFTGLPEYVDSNPDDEEPLVIELVYIEGPNAWDLGRVVGVFSFWKANQQLDLWGKTGRAAFSVYILDELVYNGVYDLAMSPADLRRQMVLYLERLGTEDAERLLLLLVVPFQQNPDDDDERGYIDPDTGAWQSRRLFERGYYEPGDAVVSETITEDQPTVEAINEALLAGTIGVGASGLVTEARPPASPEGRREPTAVEEEQIEEVMGVLGMGRPAPTPEEEAEDEAEDERQAAIGTAQRRERIVGVTATQQLTDMFGPPKWAPWWPEDVTEHPELGDLPRSKGWQVSAVDWIFPRGEGLFVWAYMDEPEGLDPRLSMGGSIDDVLEAMESELFEGLDTAAALTRRYGAPDGPSADWISMAWHVGGISDRDLFVVDQEEEDDHGRSVYAIVGRKWDEENEREDDHIYLTGDYVEVTEALAPCAVCGEIVAGNTCCPEPPEGWVVPQAETAPEPDRIVDFDADEAEYFGDEDDGVYFQVATVPNGLWYVTAVVDCDSAGFVDDLITDDGPYFSEAAARAAGAFAAMEWIDQNNVELDEEDRQRLLRVASEEEETAEARLRSLAQQTLSQILEQHGNEIETWTEYSAGRNQANDDRRHQHDEALLLDLERVATFRDPGFVRGYAEVILGIERADVDATTPAELRPETGVTPERLEEARGLLARARADLGDLEGAELDLLADNMTGSLEELQAILVALGERPEEQPIAVLGAGGRLPTIVLDEQFGRPRPLPWNPAATGWYFGGDRWIQYRRQQDDGTPIYAVVEWSGGDTTETIFQGRVDDVILWLLGDLSQEARDRVQTRTGTGLRRISSNDPAGQTHIVDGEVDADGFEQWVNDAVGFLSEKDARSDMTHFPYRDEDERIPYRAAQELFRLHGPWRIEERAAVFKHRKADAGFMQKFRLWSAGEADKGQRVQLFHWDVGEGNIRDIVITTWLAQYGGGGAHAIVGFRLVNGDNGIEIMNGQVEVPYGIVWNKGHRIVRKIMDLLGVRVVFTDNGWPEEYYLNVGYADNPFVYF